MDHLCLQPERWAEHNFGAAALGDRRRTRRLVEAATLAAKRPGGSLPQMMQEPADLEAFYRLVNRKETTHQTVIQTHLDRTRERMQHWPQTVLIAKDATELDFTTRTELKNLGQIGTGSRRGYLCHNALAVCAATKEVLGLADQRLYRRPRVGRGETPQQRRVRTNRQSRLWVASSDAIGTAPPGQHWVEVCDREADTFEYFDRVMRTGRHFLVRSKSNRLMEYVQDGVRQPGKLHDYVRTLPALAHRQIRVPAKEARAATKTQPALPAQAARTAEVAVTVGPVWLRPPDTRRGEHGRSFLAVSVVRVWEPQPPANVEELEWILLRDERIDTGEQASVTSQWYESRWLVEDFHKGQKTGCQIERPQFTKEERLEPVIAMLSVVAVLLLQLRSLSRQEEAKERPATDHVPPLFVVVLSQWRWPKEPPRLHMTVFEFTYALARLGGHQNRKSDGPPGWIVLWRGWTQLQAQVDAVHRMQENQCGET